ncbi:TIGR02186 family protein [Actibacterium sp. MT2.3-13A]|uniref:TIGR02186 family protein n=1 Tax=Actibacterium sp. MT2.3-13A TaxID=2828332 RepID=UPI001BAB1586|nr:TIGR02186 family protein [Actibacterium sp. MT2.3-13A]
MAWRWLLLCLLIATPLRAGEEVVAGLSQARVSITTDFKGSEILVFGAVKRSAPAPADPPLHVIVTVAGPTLPVTVRKKDLRFGIWVNAEAVEVDAAPSFYAISTTAPLDEILSQTEDLRHHISIGKAIRAVDTGAGADGAAPFTEALIRIRTADGLYQIRESTVTLSEDTLFRTGIALPANLTEGDYTTRIFLTRGRAVIDAYETRIGVQKVGLERWIYNLAQVRPLIYGLLSLAIAIAAGWGASTVFRYIRG